MARPITERPDQDFMQGENLPGVIPEVATFWDAPKGIDLVTPLNRLGADKTPYSQNLRLTMAGRYITRPGTVEIGSTPTERIIGLVIASTPQGVDYYVRVTESRVEVSTGGAWETYTGPILGASSAAQAKFAAWGSKLMFTDQSTGLYEIDFSAKTYTLIPAAPVAKYLTVFGGRVVLSNIVTGGLSTRVQWSVKNDNTDWSGLGSGFDDMLSAPGGVVDVQKGIWPLTDTEALVLRTSSIWIMSLTGFSDAPFLFSYRFAQGTDSPDSVARLPDQSLILLGRDDVVMATPSGIQDLGLPIRERLLGTEFVPRRALGVYDTREMRYLIHVPDEDPDVNEGIAWEFHVPTQSWHRHVWPMQIGCMAAGGNQRLLSIDELPGTIENLEGTIQELGILGRVPGLMFSQRGSEKVVQESDSSTTDVINRPTPPNFTQPVAVELWSGLVQPGGPLARAMLVSVSMEYTASRAVTGVLQVSTDGGTTWEAYGTVTFAQTVVPQVVTFRRSVERKQYQFRLTSTDAAGLELIAAHAYGSLGAPVNL